MNNAELESKLLGAPVGFAVVEGPEMVFTVANARYLEMVGRTSVVGLRWIDAFPELVDSPTHDAVRRAYLGEKIEVREFSVPLVRDGALRDTYFTFTLDPTRDDDGNVNGFVVIAYELTEVVERRREAERISKQLLESERRCRALFESLDDGFCLMEMIFDEARTKAVDYRFLECNEAFLRHTGLPYPVGKTARELVPDLDESWFRLYGNVALTGEPHRFENNAPAMGRWFDVFANRVGDPGLGHVGLVFKDVSQRKRIEEEKEELLRAEQAARQEAETANRLKDEFLATVSHELRTPLNAMLGWAALLRTGQVSSDKVSHALETIERNARSQSQLVEDLLDVSRILEGKLRLDIEPIELHPAVVAAIETVKPAADAKGIRVQVALSSGGMVMGDSHRLQQVVWNLLSNAVKFTPKGGRVQVLLEHLESSVELTVADTGMGIRAEFLPHVFERFRQADGGSTRPQGGLGLGLSIVRNLVEMHGGTVTAHSEGPGLGARFVVRLPIALARSTSVASSPDFRASLQQRGYECPPELEGLEVLAVDDEPDSLDMLRGLLESCGARVRVASSVREAMAAFSREVPHILLSDIGMPEEDGFSLISQVRKLSIADGGDTPAVALTAYARTEDRTRCLLAGFSSHVPKPVEPIELVAVVASLAGRTRGGRA